MGGSPISTPNYADNHFVVAYQFSRAPYQLVAYQLPAPTIRVHSGNVYPFFRPARKPLVGGKFLSLVVSASFGNAEFKCTEVEFGAR